MRSISLSRKSLLALILIPTIIGVSLAVVYFSLELPGNVHITGVQVEYWNKEKTAQLFALDFGDLMPTNYKLIIGNIKNVGDIPVYWTWRCEDLPEGLELTCIFDETGLGPIEVPQGTYYGVSRADTGPIPVGGFTMAWVKFKLTHVGADGGDYSFTVYIDVSDTK